MAKAKTKVKSKKTSTPAKSAMSKSAPTKKAAAVKASSKKATPKAKPAPQKSKKITFASTVESVVNAARGAIGLADQNDLIEIITQDHKPLKELIKKMKDSGRELSEREAAFGEFAPLLLTHARPEEKTLYSTMKSGADMREDGFEGDVEHAICDQLIEEIKRTDDQDLRSARIKVLAELVEHHIKEEEEDMLPEFRRATDANERIELGKQFLELKQQLQADGSDDAPSEATLREEGMINKPIHA